MKTRPTSWFNVTEEVEYHGIKVLHPKRGWIDAGDDSGQFLFTTESERDLKRKELRARKWPQYNH